MYLGHGENFFLMGKYRFTSNRAALWGWSQEVSLVSPEGWWSQAPSELCFCCRLSQMSFLCHLLCSSPCHTGFREANNIVRRRHLLGTCAVTGPKFGYAGAWSERAESTCVLTALLYPKPSSLRIHMKRPTKTLVSWENNVLKEVMVLLSLSARTTETVWC